MVEVKAGALCPSQRSCAQRQGTELWGSFLWEGMAAGANCPMLIVVTVSAFITPCFCPLGQARRHGTCWLPRNEGLWGCRVTGMVLRWATGFVLHVLILISSLISRVTKEVEEKR